MIFFLLLEELVWESGSDALDGLRGLAANQEARVTVTVAPDEIVCLPDKIKPCVPSILKQMGIPKMMGHINPTENQGHFEGNCLTDTLMPHLAITYKSFVLF